MVTCQNLPPGFYVQEVGLICLTKVCKVIRLLNYCDVKALALLIRISSVIVQRCKYVDFSFSIQI